MPSLLCAVSTVHAYTREVISGIHRFQREHPQWMIYRSDAGTLMRDGQIEIMSARNFDAMICFTGEAAEEQRLQQLRIPSINVSARRPHSLLPRVLPDHERVGELAAEHLLSCGLRHFAYAGHEGLYYSTLRFRGFCSVMEAQGLQVTDFQKQSGAKDALVLEWAREQTEPVGVMTAFDSMARRIADEALFTGIAVPDQLALISADNSDVQSQLGCVQLSSVLTEGPQVGWNAFQLLDQHLRQQAPLPSVTWVPPREVLARESTDTVAGVPPRVKEALRYIRRHAMEGIQVGDVLQEAGISRSSLDQYLQERLGHSAHEEIKRRQLEHACSLLTGTTLSVAEISKRSGFSTASYFRNVFKKAYHQTPLDYRES